MNLFVLSESKKFKNAFKIFLVKKGSSINFLKKIDELDLIKKEDSVCVIDDDTVEEEKLFSMVNKYKGKIDKIKFVLIRDVEEMDRINELMKKGLDWILPKTWNVDRLIDHIYDLISRNVFFKDRRNYQRVKPDSNEEATIKITHFDDTVLTGKITDISVGGLAAEFSPEDLNSFEENTIYENVSIKLPNKVLHFSIKLVRKGGNKVAFSIFQIQESALNILAEYISQKLLVEFHN